MAEARTGATGEYRRGYRRGEEDCGRPGAQFVGSDDPYGGDDDTPEWRSGYRDGVRDCYDENLRNLDARIAALNAAAQGGS